MVMMDGYEDGGREMPDFYLADSARYDGFANLPALLLRCCTVYPYFGDLVKSALIHFEFNLKGKYYELPIPLIFLED
jgi:hypothetical protein